MYSFCYLLCIIISFSLSHTLGGSHITSPGTVSAVCSLFPFHHDVVLHDCTQLGRVSFCPSHCVQSRNTITVIIPLLPPLSLSFPPIFYSLIVFPPSFPPFTNSFYCIIHYLIVFKLLSLFVYFRLQEDTFLAFLINDEVHSYDDV